MHRFAASLLIVCSTAWAAAPPKARPVEPPAPAPVVDPGPQPVPEVQPPGAPVVPRAVSTSRQFIVSGGESDLRSSVASLAEETKRSLLDLAGLKDEWKVPITMKLAGKPGDPAAAEPVEFDLFYSEQSWVLSLTVHVERGLDQERFARAVMSALLYEQALRNLPPGPRASALLVPPWLVEGLQEAIAWKAGRSDRKLYANQTEIYKLDDLFAVTNAGHDAMDGGSRLAFRVASGAMVMALIHQANPGFEPGKVEPGKAAPTPVKAQGNDSFKKFLAEAANFGGDMPILMKRCFPDLNLSETSLNKWWQLQMLNIKQPKLTDTMTVEETDAALEDAAKLRFRNAEGKFIEKPLASGWQDLATLPQAARLEAVRPTEDGLVRLSYRCFPSYRPLIFEYQSVLADIVKGKTPRTAGQLATLADTRTTMREREHRAHDYMDWFEITRASKSSGEFEGFLKLKDNLEYEAPERRDPVSSYLDNVQKIYGSPAPRK